MGELLNIGPFKGITDFPDERGLQTVFCQDLLIDGGRLKTVPQARLMDTNRYCGRGIYVWGYRHTAIIVTIGEDTTTDPNQSHIIYKASRGDFAVQVDLTDYYGERPTRTEPYWFESMADSIYFGCGQQVFVVDTQTLEPSVMTMSAGRESQTVAYLNGGSIPARWARAYQGRMWFGLSETKDFNTTITIDQNDPLIPSVNTLLANGQVRYGPRDILFSDPSEPNHVQWYASFTIDDQGCEVTGFVPWSQSACIFTTKGLWQLSGATASDWQLQQVNQFADCVAPRAIVSTMENIVWIGSNAIWRLSGEGLARYPNVDWFFGTSAMEPYSTGQQGVSNNAGRNDLYNSRIVDYSGASFIGGKIAVFSGYVMGTYFLEISSGSITTTGRWGFQLTNASNGSSGMVVFDASTSGILDSGTGLLLGYRNVAGTLNAMGYVDATDSPRVDVSPRGSIPSISVRIAGNGQTKRAIGKEFVVTTLPATQMRIDLYPLDEMIRQPATGEQSTRPDLLEGYTETISTPPGGAEEGSVWNGTGVNWLAASPAAGTTQPRWSWAMPTHYRFNARQSGRELWLTLTMTSASRNSIESFAIETETEVAP